MAATALMPSAMPRCVVGSTSVRMAVELAISMAPPTPWTTRSRMISTAASGPVPNTVARRIEPTVNTRKPRL
jgi:hypothetical protein